MSFAKKHTRYWLSVVLAAVFTVISFAVGVLYDQPIVPHKGGQEYTIHVSVDDTFAMLWDLTENQDQYSSIFDQPSFSYLKELHEKYGAVYSLYCYYQQIMADGVVHTLAEVTGEYCKEFEMNSDWLRLSFHAMDDTAYQNQQPEEEIVCYEKTLQELRRIAGSDAVDTGFIRLDRYAGSRDLTRALAELPDGPQGLFCAENSNRRSYGLTAEEEKVLYQDDWYVDADGMQYTPTDVRIENIGCPLDFYTAQHRIAGQRIQILFTHEWILQDASVQKYLEWFLAYGNSTGGVFRYLTDGNR